LVTDLPDDVARSMGAQRVEASQVQDIVSRHRGRLIVIPNASLLVRRE
jgi:hypothetical protein